MKSCELAAELNFRLPRDVDLLLATKKLMRRWSPLPGVHMMGVILREVYANY